MSGARLRAGESLVAAAVVAAACGGVALLMLPGAAGTAAAPPEATPAASVAGRALEADGAAPPDAAPPLESPERPAGASAGEGARPGSVPTAGAHLASAGTRPAPAAPAPAARPRAPAAPAAYRAVDPGRRAERARLEGYLVDVAGDVRRPPRERLAALLRVEPTGADDAVVLALEALAADPPVQRVAIRQLGRAALRGSAAAVAALTRLTASAPCADEARAALARLEPVAQGSR